MFRCMFNGRKVLFEWTTYRCAYLTLSSYMPLAKKRNRTRMDTKRASSTARCRMNTFGGLQIKTYVITVDAATTAHIHTTHIRFFRCKFSALNLSLSSNSSRSWYVARSPTG